MGCGHHVLEYVMMKKKDVLEECPTCQGAGVFLDKHIVQVYAMGLSDPVRFKPGRTEETPCSTCNGAGYVDPISQAIHTYGT